MADWIQSPGDSSPTEDDLMHIDALAARYDMKTIQSLCAQYTQWKRQSMSSAHTSSTGFSSIGGSSVESGASPLPNADNFHCSTQSQLGQTVAKQNTPSKFFCTCHHEAGHGTITFGRKAECKSHMIKFHNLKKEWKCPNCLTIFDRDIDYDKHIRDEHAGQPVSRATDVVTNLLAKQVFACGFKGCENLFGYWSEWFDHITAHMKDGKKPSDWSYTVVIRNLLRQPDLRDEWEQMMLHRYRTTQHALEWDPSSARQLCQKLECRDFRPGVRFIVGAADLLGRLASAPAGSPSTEFMHIGLDTPSCDSVPYYEGNEGLDRILMRPNPSNTTSPSVHDLPSQYFLHTFDQHQAGGTDFGFMPVQPLPGIQHSDLSNIEPYHKSTSAQGYGPTQTEQYSQFSPTVYSEGVSQLHARLDFDNEARQAFTGNAPVPDGDQQPTHILQDLNYFDYERFAKSSTPRPRGGFLRRVRSSKSLSSKKSQSSLEADSTQENPPLPPVPSNTITSPARSRASSITQRNRLTRKTGQAANPL